MGAQEIVPSMDRRLQQAVLGGQGLLMIASVPAAADNALVGQNLVDAGELTVAGDYQCLVPMAGMVTELEVHLTATFAAGSVTSDLGSLYVVRDFTDPTTWVEKVAGTGDGALTTTVRQSSDIAGLRGEQYALLKVTLAGGAEATFTQAEYNGI
jgi:hypothetical protein